MRSVVRWCVEPSGPLSGPTRLTSVSNARGQSSSVPSSRPMRWSGMEQYLTEPGQVVGELALPTGPVVWHVVPPDVEFTAQALRPQRVREPAGARDGAGRVLLPRALPDHQQHRELLLQPLEVRPVEPRDVGERIVEVHRVPAVAP